ncbi:MAG: DNA helicase RecQ [Candidatus Brocadia sp.]|nr:ATP-dependent DNA helicase RecQ [Anaerolineales bacterium]MCC6324486.1 DNA helicase RecQ [Candidatus Brocadia sp.]MCE7911095.1 DNA helicase RecQ [Candidatus Brocadia sp. AMX3]MDG5997317.1 DNA helicase RecQ [Candidatus Brocadia sp.]RIJ99845.1 MAG: DNA helicase RecQ [Candidatus Brocadia sp.]
MYDLLQKYFGYTSFYPLQEDIIKEVLAQRDVFVLMPTGSGKSLCYQLPALLFTGVTIVISPLIALMKDQVDGLLANGIPAAYINSSLSYHEVDARRQQLLKNELKILYVAPERLLMSEFLEFLRGLKVCLFAIDESHCISEWGHDFRPEYRQLKVLKEKFPHVPVMALTATATQVVQDDIIRQLNLSRNKVFKASFNRKNLYYQIKPKHDPFHQILQYLNGRRTDSGIIYCQSRKAVETLASGLQAKGYRALPYHAGLTAEVRTEHQERFIRDDVEIIVATIAFGMGIHKPGVRYVIHYDLPKSIEGYYQETGRAGRDGLPGDCILFFSYADKFKIEHFIQQKEDENERQIAYKQLRELITYCESNVCRRRVLLAYFGEQFEEPNCGGCDVCVEPKERFDGTIAAQKILSCVYRTGERFGINYIVDVLLGARNQKVLQNRHDTLKTYGVGKEYAKVQWQSFIRELIQLGYLKLDGDEYPILKLHEKSRPVLLGDEKVSLIKPAEKIPVQKAERSDNYDHTLFERLRALRKTLADQEGVPPYIIFHDTSLKEMTVSYPQSLLDLRKISGVGDQKLVKYGKAFVEEIVNYCEENNIMPRQFCQPSAEFSAKQQKISTIQLTFDLYKQRLTIPEIAQKRGLAVSTIASHLEKLILDSEDISLDDLVTSEKQQQIRKVFAEAGMQTLSPVKEKLGEGYSYEEIRLVRAKVMVER